MKLPQKLPLDQMATTWASAIEPVLNNPPNVSSLLKNVSLVAGYNTISHRLGRKLEGWILTRLRASATIYDDQDNNPNPQLTLILIASAPVVVDLELF